MSAIARVLTEAGRQVTGSDLRESAVLGSLRDMGVRVDIGHRASQTRGADLVIASAAVSADNPELGAARAGGIPTMPRGEALARLLEGLRTVAVSGTHGKTTTTGMVATITQIAGLEPSYLLGSDLATWGPGGRLGSGDVAVVEADEAYGSFLWLRPDIAVVTNVDADHLDYYATLEALHEAFARFVSQSSGTAVLCLDDTRATELAAQARSVLTYGFHREADVGAAGVVNDARGSRFELLVGGRSAGRATLSIGGRHNVQNALGAAAACIALGIDTSAIFEGLSAFRGARRRFEYRGGADGIDFVDDYAHHPTEIEATLEAARSGPWSRIIAVFQPHLYSRTEALWHDFGAALAHADLVVVTDVYGAREEPIPGVTGKLIVEALCEAAPGRRAAYLPRLDEAAGFVRFHMRPGDLVLSLGAGDITTLPDRVLSSPRGE